MTTKNFSHLSYTADKEMQCECDRHFPNCVTDDCFGDTYCKFHITSFVDGEIYEDNSYWLCLECLVHHYKGDPKWMGFTDEDLADD